MKQPSVLVEYPGPTEAEGEQDVSLYLRPESNGIRVESTIMRCLREYPGSEDCIRVVYLANLPGSFVADRSIVAEHYATRIRFANRGRDLFTPQMRQEFERHFDRPFDDAQVLGAFQALDALDMGADELFKLRVPEADFTYILGQTLKRVGETYVVNYDIPALLHRHNETTDIFAMLLRMRISYPEFASIVVDIGHALVEQEIVSGRIPMSRIFHYSKGPFEQILDGIGYIYTPDGNHIPYRRMSFLHYLTTRGFAQDHILRAVAHPIVRLARASPPGAAEVNLFEYTRGCTYSQAATRFTEVEEVLQI